MVFPIVISFTISVLQYSCLSPKKSHQTPLVICHGLSWIFFHWIYSLLLNLALLLFTRTRNFETMRDFRRLAFFFRVFSDSVWTNCHLALVFHSIWLSSLSWEPLEFYRKWKGRREESMRKQVNADLTVTSCSEWLENEQELRKLLWSLLRCLRNWTKALFGTDGFRF